MVDILFPTGTSPGARPSEGSGRLINCFAEKNGDGARQIYSRRSVPGLTRLTTTTDTTNYVGIRGYHYFNGDLYVAVKNRLQRVNVSGGVYTATDLGSLPGSNRVTFARNNKAPTPDILCTTENDTYVVNRTSAPTSLGDADLPNALTIDFLDGYFIWAIRDGRFFVSGINDKTVGALDFGKAESHPGGILRALAFGELLYLCGPVSIEVWQNAGNATGSPFSRAAVIPRGIVNTFAIAGNENGFASLIFVGDDNAVYRLDGGYTPTRISTPDLDRLITAVADKTQIDVTVSVTEGHSWATVTGPTFTWEYELGTGQWHERQSYLSNRWRAVCSAQAFGGWVVGDRTTGDIWLLDPNSRREGTKQLVMTLISLPSASFPNRVVIPRADFDIVVGTGLVTGADPIEVAPTCMISWSNDGGNTWSTPLQRAIGRLANHNMPVSVNRTGTAGRYGRVWKIDVADPVFVSIGGGTMDATALSR